MEALHDVVKAGKARYLGASSMQAWQFAKLQHVAERNGWTKFVSMQDQYTLINRGEELEMFGLLADQGVGSIPWSPLAQGVVTRPWGDRTTNRGARGTDRFGRPLWLDTRPGRHRRHPTHRRNPWGVDGSGCAGVGAEEPGR
jgi:aryl-alcohol dehydrogenase-like predicted oxidoreductase